MAGGLTSYIYTRIGFVERISRYCLSSARGRVRAFSHPANQYGSADHVCIFGGTGIEPRYVKASSSALAASAPRSRAAGARTANKQHQYRNRQKRLIQG